MDINEIAIWRTELFESLESVEQGIDELCQLIRFDKHLPCWVYDSETQRLLEGDDARDKACAVIAALEYIDELDTREAITLPGVIGYSSHTKHAVAQLNQAKERFRTVLQKVQGENVVIEVYDTRKRKIQKRVPLAKHTLEKMGRGRLHVIQTYRLIKLFSERSQRVGFTWARTNKVEKVTKKQVTRILYNLGESDDVYTALNTLSGIPEHEILAHVRPPHLHARANLRWDDMNPSHSSYPQQVNCSLPLFFPCEDNQPLPFGGRLEKPQERKPRQKRLNQKLEEFPLFDVVSIFRYLPQYR